MCIMKKKTMRLMVLLIVSLSAVICLKIVGAERTQAVWCGWLNYKAGCAGGAGDCYDMNPCNGEKFMVHDTWCDPEV